jgi:uncharacterized protein
MRALLDVNVLIALLDAGHVHHDAASSWLAAHIDQGWASCPLTQNGCLRILSADAYPRSQPVAAVAARLREAVQTPFHEFWPDDISGLDVDRFDTAQFLSSRQITDSYLLGLAVHRDGLFVSLDRGIHLGVVRGAEARHLALI